ncbi:MAG: M20/M25/M40 family metallo-hydrolase [Thermoleophilia bacterium]|nr:M20/M25/M40 family metallo-hydrolase [Thermoleophilia bacterium]
MPEPIELARSLIRFDTTNPPGNEAPCVEYVRELLAGAGVESELYARDPARPNLVARLRGDGTAPPLLLYGHVDVVTTAGQRWSRPPFDAELADGFVWGRGALDMKSGVAMLISAFLRAKAEALPLKGDLILAVLSDEENGGDYGARFLVDEHPELFAGVRWALGEFGGFTQHIGGRRVYPIQVSEKQLCWLRGVLRGRGGHGAIPARGKTIGALGELLTRLDRRQPPVHVNPIVRTFVETLAEVLPRPKAVLLRRVLDPRLADGVLRLLGPRFGTLAASLRNTATVTIIRGGEKVNVIPSSVELEIDGRLLPGYAPSDLMRELHELVGDALELEVVRHDPGPPDPDLTHYETLAAILRELEPGAVTVPLLQPGVTDGRFFARLGIQTYGFLPTPLPEGLVLNDVIHAADERVPVEALAFGTEGVYRAVQRLAA